MTDNERKLDAQLKKNAKSLARHEKDMEEVVAYLQARAARARGETAALLHLHPVPPKAEKVTSREAAVAREMKDREESPAWKMVANLRGR